MLNHVVIGKPGAYMVAYQTPGCKVMTPVCECMTKWQANREAKRLNARQVEREKELQRERELCSRRRIKTDMGAI